MRLVSIRGDSRLLARLRAWILGAGMGGAGWASRRGSPHVKPAEWGRQLQFLKVFDSGECTLAMQETWEGVLCSPCYLEEGVYKPEQRGGFWFLGKKEI